MKLIYIFLILTILSSCKKTTQEEFEVLNPEDANTPLPPQMTKTVIASTPDSINALYIEGTTMYILGSFSGLGSVSSRGIIKYNGSTFSAYSTDLSAGSNIHAMLRTDYGFSLIGGRYFLNSFPSTAAYFGKVNMSGVVSNFNVTGQVNVISEAYQGGQYFAAGKVTNVNNQPAIAAVYDYFYGGSLYECGGIANVASSSEVYWAFSLPTSYIEMVAGGEIQPQNYGNIITNSNGDWARFSWGFDSAVYDSEVYNGYHYYAGAMRMDADHLRTVGYVNKLVYNAVAQTAIWTPLGNNELPGAAYDLEVYKNELFACGYTGNTGYLYSYFDIISKWTNRSSLPLKQLKIVKEFRGELYGIEYDPTTQQTSLVKFSQ